MQHVILICNMTGKTSKVKRVAITPRSCHAPSHKCTCYTNKKMSRRGKYTSMSMIQLLRKCHCKMNSCLSVIRFVQVLMFSARIPIQRANPIFPSIYLSIPSSFLSLIFPPSSSSLLTSASLHFFSQRADDLMRLLMHSRVIDFHRQTNPCIGGRRRRTKRKSKGNVELNRVSCNAYSACLV